MYQGNFNLIPSDFNQKVIDKLTRYTVKLMDRPISRQKSTDKSGVKLSRDHNCMREKLWLQHWLSNKNAFYKGNKFWKIKKLSWWLIEGNVCCLFIAVVVMSENINFKYETSFNRRQFNGKKSESKLEKMPKQIKGDFNSVVLCCVCCALT